MQAIRGKCFIAVLSVPVLAISIVALAQDHEGNIGPGETVRHGRGMMPSTDDREEHLSQILDLTDGQKARIRPMLDDEASKMQSVWQDEGTPRDQKRLKLQQIHQETTAQMKVVLTTEQQKKLAEVEERTKQRVDRARHGQRDNNNQ
jgi:Spy/CpxP family protein refolding chaperone